MSNMPPNSEPLDTKAFARRCGVEPETVRRWCRPSKGPNGAERPPLLTPAWRTPTGFMRFSEEQVAQMRAGGMTERARDIEAHVAAAFANQRLRRRGLN